MIKRFELNDIQIWTVFNYKWNKHIVLWINREDCYVIDIEYNPLFDDEENQVYKLNYADIELYYLTS